MSLNRFSLLLLVFLWVVVVPQRVDATDVTGDITVNTTWSFANSPYIVKSFIAVNSGVTLTILQL